MLETCLLDAFEAFRKEVETIDFHDLPGVLIAHSGVDLFLPTYSAVYFLDSERLGLLYIGKAKSLRARWARVKVRNPDSSKRKWALPKRVGRDFTITDWKKSHAKLRQAIDLADVTLRWMRVPREMLTAVEMTLIQHHQPPWNHQRN